MALQVWLPFNRTYKNYGIDTSIKISSINSSYVNLEDDESSPIGGKSLEGHSTGYGLTLNSNLGNNILAEATEYSVSTFVYFNDMSKDDVLICGPGAITCGIVNNGVYVRTDANPSTTSKVITFPDKTANTWTHYAFTFKNGKIKAYVNGEYYAEATKGTKMISGITTGHVAGHATGYTFDGKISDFRIYDNALTDKDVKRIYQQKLFELIPYSGVKDVLFDRSGLMNMPLVNQNAVFQNNALYFNGTNARLRPKNGNVGFDLNGGTLSVWFTPKVIPSDYHIIYIDSTSQFGIGFYSSTSLLVTSNNNSSNPRKAIFPAVLTANTLNNVIVIYDSGYTSIQCIVNGESKTNTSTQTRWYELNGLTIGGRTYNDTSLFNGNIHKIDVYKKQFTQDEAVELYNSERGMFLPDDYIQLEYAQSDGNQYINTEIYTTNSTNLEVTVKTNNNGSHLFFGYFENATNAFQFAQSSNGNCFICDIGNTSNRIVSNILGTSDFHILLEKNKSFYIDGKLIGIATNASIPTNKIIHLFKSSYYTATTTSVKIKNAKIWNDNILVRNFTPAKRKSDNVIGMYDMVSRHFFTNEGSGSFTGA